MYIWTNYSSHVSLWSSARRLIMLTQVIDLFRPVTLKTRYSLCAFVNSLVKVSRAKLGNQSPLPYYTKITPIPKATIAKLTRCTRLLNSVGYNFTLHFPRKLIAGCLLSNKVKVSSAYRYHIEGRPLLFSIQDKITRNRSEFFVQENGKPSMIWLSHSYQWRSSRRESRMTWFDQNRLFHLFLRTTYLLCDETPQYRGLVMKPVKLQNKYSVLLYDLSHDSDHPQPWSKMVSSWEGRVVYSASIQSILRCNTSTTKCECFIIGYKHRETKWSTRPKAWCFYRFEVFEIYDATRSMSFWYGFSNSTIFPWDMNNANDGCCLKFLFGRRCVHSCLCERWLRLLKKPPKAVFCSPKTAEDE